MEQTNTAEVAAQAAQPPVHTFYNSVDGGCYIDKTGKSHYFCGGFLIVEDSDTELLDELRAVANKVGSTIYTKGVGANMQGLAANGASTERGNAQTDGDVDPLQKVLMAQRQSGVAASGAGATGALNTAQLAAIAAAKK